MIQHDKELKRNLIKFPKLTYLALHPGNNKQNVPLALETTITTAKLLSKLKRCCQFLRDF